MDAAAPLTYQAFQQMRKDYQAGQVSTADMVQALRSFCGLRLEDAEKQARAYKAVRVVPEGEALCQRCGGHGGFSGWPGFVCFECGGRGLVAA